MARTSAVVLASLAGLLIAELLTARSLEAYGIALVSTLVVASVTTAWRAWSSSSFEVRTAAATLGVVAVVGQSVASTVGGPGGSGAHWTLLAVGIVLTGSLALAVAVVERPRAARDSATEHPYAL